MRTHIRRAAVLALLALACASTSFAQAPVDQERVRISGNGDAQFPSGTVNTSTTQPVYLENAAIDTSYKAPIGLLVDGGIALRIAGAFSIGVSVSSAMAKRDADITAAVPHPFFFKTPRTVNGTANGIRRDELVTHIQAIYSLRPTKKMDVALSAGPSIFHARQDVVTGISFSDTYPYDTPAFTAATTARASGNGTGFNVGADVGWHLSRHAGVGAEVRFSRATVALAVPAGVAPVSIQAGGAQAAGGLRLYF